MRKAFDKEVVPDVKKPEEIVERKAITKEIVSLFQLALDYANYSMVIGNHGTGKTTLVRHVGHQLQGIVYVDIDSIGTADDQFEEAFAQATRWSPRTSSWLEVLNKTRIAPEEKTVKLVGCSHDML